MGFRPGAEANIQPWNTSREEARPSRVRGWEVISR